MFLETKSNQVPVHCLNLLELVVDITEDDRSLSDAAFTKQNHFKLLPTTAWATSVC